MKKYSLIVLFLAFTCALSAQAPITDTAALRAAITADILPNSQITATKLKRILDGFANVYHPPIDIYNIDPLQVFDSSSKTYLRVRYGWLDSMYALVSGAKNIYNSDGNFTANRNVGTGGFQFYLSNNSSGYLSVNNNGFLVTQPATGGSVNYYLSISKTQAELLAYDGVGYKGFTADNSKSSISTTNSTKTSKVEVLPGTVEITPNDSLIVKNLPASDDTTNNKPMGVNANGKVFKMNTWAGSGGGAGVNYVIQTSAPSDTTTFWLDSSGGFKRVWPLKQRIRAAWRTVKWYDPVANLFSHKRPKYILITGQSNAAPRCCGGDTLPHPRVVEYRNGAWGIDNATSPTFNNLGLQVGKEYARKDPDLIVRIVTVSEASQKIEKWYHDSTKTDEIAAVVRAANIDSFDVIVFKQGESNADLAETEAVYSAKFYQVFNAYRDSSWFGKSGTVLAVGLNESYLNTGVFDFYQHMNNPEKGGYGYTGVSMLGLSRVGGIHINGASFDSLAKRFPDPSTGIGTQYALEKTPNVGWLSDTELGIWPAGTNLPTLRLLQSFANSKRGGFIKANDVTSQLIIGYNPTNNGTVTADSATFFMNYGNGQIGLGNANGLLTTNASMLNISTYKPIAFSITSPGTNTPLLQIDNVGRVVNKPFIVYNRFSNTGDIVIHSSAGDINNGVFRKSRVNLSGTNIPSFSGDFWKLDGSANKSYFGTHSPVDTASASDSIVMTMPMTGDRIGVKNISPTSTLTVGGSFATAYVAKTANYTATIIDHTIECTANTFTVTLPTAASITGREYTIVNSGSGTITISTTSSQTFTNITSTPTSLTLSPVGSAAIVAYSVKSNGTNWVVTGKVKNE